MKKKMHSEKTKICFLLFVCLFLNADTIFVVLIVYESKDSVQAYMYYETGILSKLSKPVLFFKRKMEN